MSIALLFNIAALIAFGVLGLLLFLVLFEPGLYYKVPTPAHKLGEAERLRLLSELLGVQPRHIEQITHYSNGQAFYSAQLAAIARAQQTLHLENYIFRPGQVAERFITALCERAAAGVQVRVIVDAIGSWQLRHKHIKRLRKAGVDIHRYHFLHWHALIRLNNRTHRNLLIVDGSEAFIGGAGIADYWNRKALPWRDTQTWCTGPIVAGLQGVFAENWLECTGEMLASPANFPAALTDRERRHPAPEPDESPEASLAPAIGLAVGSTPTSGRSNQARVLIQFLLASARQEILISSPYFIPDRGIRHELIAARRRGVQVKVVTGGPYTDHHLVRRAGRKRYGPLLSEGVEIFEYADSMMHAKILLVDRVWSVVGSTNFDHRSFGINDEVNLAVLDSGFCHALLTDFQIDCRNSQPFTYDDWLKRPLSERVLAWFGTVIERHQ